jgi:hypothetical protein
MRQTTPPQADAHARLPVDRTGHRDAMSEPQTENQIDPTAGDRGPALSTSGLGEEEIADAMEVATAGPADHADDELPHPDLIDGPAAASATGVGTDDLDQAMGET